MMRKVPLKSALLPFLLLLGLGALLYLVGAGGNRLTEIRQRLRGRATVGDRLEQFQAEALRRVGGRIAQGEKLVLLRILVLKEEKKLEIYGLSPFGGEIGFLKEYPVLAASGGPGPKLREGDNQVPEGFYRIDSLHPNSRFHLALKVAYPAEEDIRCARLDGREPAALGSNIMIHGRGGSIGCVSVDNEAIEEIFTLAAQVGAENIELLIAPYDFRKRPFPEKASGWLKERYEKLQTEMRRMSR